MLVPHMTTRGQCPAVEVVGSFQVASVYLLLSRSRGKRMNSLGGRRKGRRGEVRKRRGVRRFKPTPLLPSLTTPLPSLFPYSSLPSHTDLSYEDFFSALKRYSSCEQRQGK